MRIVVCGLNGAGKSTLGQRLARCLDCKFADIEDYFFPKDDPNYLYASPRTKHEVAALMLADMKRYPNYLLASVRANYSVEAESMFDLAIYLDVPKDERLKRVRKRSYDKFGERMMEGGDLFESESEFFNMVANRSSSIVEDWLKKLNIPVLKLDGTRTVEENLGISERYIHNADKQ